MFSENYELSIPQIKKGFSIEVFATFSLTMPALLTRGMGYYGIYPFLMGTFLAVLYLFFLLGVKQKIRIHYGDYVKEQFGKGMQWVILLLYFVRFLIKSGYTMLLFVTLIQKNLLRSQSKFIILLPFVILCGYVAYQGRETRGKTLEILSFFIFVPLFLTILLCISEINLKEFLPKGVFQWDQFWTTSMLVFLTYNPMEFLLFYGSEQEETKQKQTRTRKAIRNSFFFVFLSHICLFFTTVGLFGVQITKSTLFPTFAIMETAKLPADFISRLDILLIVFWIFGLFSVVSGYSTYAMWLVKDRVSNRNKSVILGVFLIMALGIALISSNLERATDIYFRYLMWIDFPLGILIPIVILLKKKRRKV